MAHREPSNHLDRAYIAKFARDCIRTYRESARLTHSYHGCAVSDDAMDVLRGLHLLEICAECNAFALAAPLSGATDTDGLPALYRARVSRIISWIAKQYARKP